MIPDILQDWTANQGSPKGRFVLVLFRVCQAIRQLPCGLWLLGSPVLLLYVIFVHWLLGIELDYKTSVGAGLSLRHGVGLVVHQNVRIGSRCLVRQGVTLGEKSGDGRCPVLEDDVQIGANAVVLGPVRIGRGAVVGAGSVVLHDVEPDSVVAGNPARLIRTLKTP
jgi:serine acetyltransferase